MLKGGHQGKVNEEDKEDEYRTLNPVKSFYKGNGARRLAESIL
jgi:hypothetical protein